MTERDQILGRIAAALERLAPLAQTTIDWQSSPAYVWSKGSVRSVSKLDALPLDRLIRIDRQKQAIVENITRHAQGYAAHDVLLWGARGMGKSALVRSAAVHVQREQPGKLALIQLSPNSLDDMAQLFGAVREVERRFIIYIDDLGFASGDDLAPRYLRSWLEGGINARPANVRLVVTSNHRAISARQSADQNPSAAINPRDAIDDSLALADRFGLSLGFHPCDRETYLKIVANYLEPLGLDFSHEEAWAWSLSRGNASGRTAQQFAVEVAGRQGLPL